MLQSSRGKRGGVFLFQKHTYSKCGGEEGPRQTKSEELVAVAPSTALNVHLSKTTAHSHIKGAYP